MLGLADFTVVYDANVLFPAPLRDFLIRLGRADLFRARYSPQILDEVFRSIRRLRESDPTRSTTWMDEQLDRTRRLMELAIPDVLVTDHESLIPSLELPDPDDRHVLAAAIRSSAQLIVTMNLKDFPRTSLEGYGLEAKHPDEFVLDLLDLNEDAVLETLRRQAAGLRHPPMGPVEVLEKLEGNGLTRSAREIRHLLCRR